MFGVLYFLGGLSLKLLKIFVPSPAEMNVKDAAGAASSREVQRGAGRARGSRT
jgi:hypothetical protein